MDFLETKGVDWVASEYHPNHCHMERGGSSVQVCTFGTTLILNHIIQKQSANSVLYIFSNGYFLPFPVDDFGNSTYFDDVFIVGSCSWCFKISPYPE